MDHAIRNLPILTRVDENRHESSLTAAILVAILMYCRQAMMNGPGAAKSRKGPDETIGANRAATLAGGTLPDPGGDYSAAALPV